MKKTFVLCTLLFVLAVSAQLSFGQKTSKPEEKENFVKGTRLLEQTPFHKDAKKLRESLLLWLIEAPDVSVTLCTDFIKPLFDKKAKYSSELTGQFTFALGAFVIEHPNNKDEKDMYQAGLVSIVNTYQSMLKEKKDAQNNFLDSLVEKKNNNELGQYVEDILNKGGCKKKQ